MIFAGLSQKEADEKGNELLELVGLGSRGHHKPDELSGGQQQRVAIARALANDPAIILADEPTANLDSKTGEEIITLMSKLQRERACTIITATHDHKMLAASVPRGLDSRRPHRQGQTPRRTQDRIRFD